MSMFFAWFAAPSSLHFHPPFTASVEFPTDAFPEAVVIVAVVQPLWFFVQHIHYRGYRWKGQVGQVVHFVGNMSSCIDHFFY